MIVRRRPLVEILYVDGPSAARRSDFRLSCRSFETDDGPSGKPEERWVHEALARAASA